MIKTLTARPTKLDTGQPAQPGQPDTGHQGQDQGEDQGQDQDRQDTRGQKFGLGPDPRPRPRFRPRAVVPVAPKLSLLHRG